MVDLFLREVHLPIHSELYALGAAQLQAKKIQRPHCGTIFLGAIGAGKADTLGLELSLTMIATIHRRF